MRSLAFTVLLAAVAVEMGAGPAEAASTKVDGAAIVRGAGRTKSEGAREWREVTTGDVLLAGLTVQASAEEPLEMLLPDGVTIQLEPGGQAHWMRATRLPTETNGWARGYHLVLQEGELEVHMPPGLKGTHAFLVSTKAGTLTDWRGQLHVVVHEDSAAAAIYQGALVVGSNGQGFPVYDGAGIVMKKGVDPDKTRGIPAAPSWDGGGSFSLAARDQRATLDFHWAGVAGASAYRIEIATDPTMVRVVHRATTTEPSFGMPEPQAGARYWAHVRAVGPVGIVGEWSTARAIRVVRYELPDGAFVANDGAIVLPDHTSVTLSDTDGVEAAYENVTGVPSRFRVPLYWAKVTGALRIADDATMRIVHLRDSSAGTETRLVLARRQLRADVDLQPKSARWPLDPVDARVVVRDPSGRIDGSTEAVAIDTMLDLTPIAVAWQRRGATFVGRVTPQPIAGPSVVRVVVKDGKGTEIGRGFIEIDTGTVPSKR
ncbi:MAG: hypothetical protein ACLP1X_04360 [Polyangiaceae bacterium]